MTISLKKNLAVIITAINLLSFFPHQVHAWDMFGLANPVEVENAILGDLGVNKSELRYSIQTLNVSRRKIDAPTVTLTFDPADPVPGEKVTVTAVPNYFLNTSDNLYFTWYLKNARCHDSHDDNYSSFRNSADFDKCNLDGDNEVDINDYKIRAMRIIANDDFAWDQDPSPYTSDQDDDGYKAVSGGDDQRGKPAHCYIHDVSSGNNYELGGCGDVETGHLFPDPPGNDLVGDGSFGLSEERFWHTNPNNNDTADTGNTDEANVVGLGENTFTFTYTEGDQVGVAVEGISVNPTQYDDSSYMTMWAFPKNKCSVDTTDSVNDNYPKTSTTSETHTDTDFSGSSYPVTLFTSADYTTTVTTTTTQEIVSGSQINDSATIRTKVDTTYHVTYTDPITSEVTDPAHADVTTHLSTCPYYENGSATTLTEDNITYICTGPDDFGSITSPTSSTAGTKMNVHDLNDCLYSNLVTPSEGGGTTEKLDVALKYLPENPINDKSGNGNGDTLSLSASVINATNTSYLNYTWEVFGSDEPNPDSWGEALSKDSLDSATQMSGLGIDSFKFNLNLTAPPKYLKVKVTVKDTLNDGEGDREGHTDVVIPLYSSTERIKVYTAKSNLELNGSGTYTPLIALPPDPLTERCLFTDPETGAQTQSAVCPAAKDEILVLQVDNASGNYSDFVWNVDGKTWICPSDSFYNCLDSTGKATDRTYIPILKEPGDNYDIQVSMLDSSTGERLNLSRNISVSSPEVTIIPQEKDASGNYICRGILLGSYTDFYGQPHEDRSDSQFQALVGNNITIIPVFSGTEGAKTFDTPADYPYQWNVDGTTITVDNATSYGYSIDLNNYGALILPPRANGDKYTVSFIDTFTPTKAVQSILNQYWNQTYTDFYERQLSDTIEIDMVSTSIAQSQTSPGKILATISSGLPAYLIFLFRIILSGTAIIFALRIIFTILPVPNTDEY